MVAPAVLAAASKAAKVAKAAKSAAQVASGQGGKGGGGKKKNNFKWVLIVAGIGAMPTLGTLLVAMILIMALIGGIGGGAAQAACGSYGENAGAGNTSDKAATNPIMPAGKMYMPSDTARDEIPPKMILASMRAAARYDGLDWTIIAGQMYQETRYGQDKSAAPGGDNGYGYKGLLQFGDWAWGQFGEDGNGDGQKDRYGVDDLAFAAANYMHALKAESNPWKALLGYSGSLETNTVYPRVVLTQAARYRGTLTDDKDLINRWYAHLKSTVEKNPSFPVLGQTSDIPEPVGNNAQPSEALSIRSKGPRSWSTPPLGGGQGGTTTAMAPMGFSRPLAAPLRPDDPPATTSGKDWQWPMKEGTYKLGTKYHQEGPHWSLGYHTGVDLEAPTGTPIYAPADGKVVRVSSGGAYGNQTRLEHANGVITLYAHQSSTSVKVGDSVKRGDQIGKVGETGNVTGAHLHWEVLMPGVDDPFRSGQDNGPGEIDPAAWLEGKITASPDYGSVPGGTGKGKDADYRDCAKNGKGTAVPPDGAGSTGPLPDVDDTVVRAALGWAQRGIGKPYEWGAPRLQGDHPTSFDCSSFTQWMYYQASGGKINVGYTTYDQQPNLAKYKVELSQAKAGDLIFFRPSNSDRSLSEHVGVVWDPAKHTILHAPRVGKNVEFSPWEWQGEITGVYRVPTAGSFP
ncbi:peptidoglycan DD-metalloendopeptidase family protein [Streptomyces sp. NPDC090077]|uniref:peptidoglycan DD-metalloendopeptidase family protein n=1 Tax=Streptomyces sp. NPDC090077 TaxID=3365938 RepID=UPI003811B1F0